MFALDMTMEDAFKSSTQYDMKNIYDVASHYVSEATKSWREDHIQKLKHRNRKVNRKRRSVGSLSKSKRMR